MSKNDCEKLVEKIAELREVFPFPKEKDYDSGYSISNKDGWHLAEIVASPEMCLDAMIKVLKTKEAQCLNTTKELKTSMEDQ